MIIRYKAGYKYQLVADMRQQTKLRPLEDIDSSGGFVTLDVKGVLHIRAGYAWDGPSGPTVDTKNFMRGSLVHDALYQLMREGLLPRSYKEYADQLLKAICLEDGMWRIRVWWVVKGLEIGGKAATLPENRKVIQTAP